MILVGLTGGIGQGKTTVSRMLRELAGAGPECDLETSYIIAELANVWIASWPARLMVPAGEDIIDLGNALIELLPDAVHQLLGKGVALEQLQIERSDESLAFNQQLIGYLQARVVAGGSGRGQFPDPITPINKALHRPLFMWLGASLVVKVDPRIWGDALQQRIQALSAAGQQFVTVGGIRSKHEVEMMHRHSGLVVRVVRPEAQISSDLTERLMLEVIPDTELVNNGTFEELEAATGRLYRDVIAGRLQPGASNQPNYNAQQS